MSIFSKFIRETIVQSLFKDIQAENRSLLKAIDKKIDKPIRYQPMVGSEDHSQGLGSASAASPTDAEPFDLLITHNEICHNHGTGVLLHRIFGSSSKLINIRSSTHFSGKSLGEVQLVINHNKRSRTQSFVAVGAALGHSTIRRILCVPFYPDDVITAIAAHEITGAPLCLYILDDQNIHDSGISDALMRELVEKSQLRLAVGPEMRDEYEKKFGHKFWVLPPVVTAEFILDVPAAPASHQADLKGVLIGNIWSSSWLEALRCLIRESGITIDWYGNTAKQMLDYDEKALAEDGIQAQGFVSELKLQTLLRNYAFAIVPSTCADLLETHQWQAELSLPSRIPYLMATANIPILVLSSKENPATNFVRRFDIGTVCDYNPANFQQVAEALCTPEAQQKYRANAAAAAPAFSSEGIAKWIWQSLKIGEPVDRRFETLFKRTSEVAPPWVDIPVPKEICWEFIPVYRALSRLREAEFAPDFVIDVGASTALWSDLCHKVFPKARYTLIDPLMNRYRARSAWYYEQHPEFECEEAAVSNQEGLMDFHVSNDMYGSRLLSDATDGQGCEVIKVPVITLDGLAERKKFVGKGLLKLDVQNAEYLALEGATRLLDQINVILVKLSFERCAKDTKTFLEMLNWLDELGFRYADEAGGWRSPKNGTLIQQDVIFVKKSELVSSPTLSQSAESQSEESQSEESQSTATSYEENNPELDLMTHLYPFLPNRNIIDIGANVGEVSEHLLDTGFSVYAFEPFPPVFEKLRQRLAGNPEFHPAQMAIGAKDTVMDLSIAADPFEGKYGDTTVYNTLLPREVSGDLIFKDKVSVTVRSLESLHQTGEIPVDIGMVKIDTEGYDLEVIRGMGDHQYPVVNAEFWDKDFTFGKADSLNHLEDMVPEMRKRGYHWNLIFCRIEGTEGINIYLNTMRTPPKAWGNIFFFREAALFQRAAEWHEKRALQTKMSKIMMGDFQ